MKGYQLRNRIGKWKEMHTYMSENQYMVQNWPVWHLSRNNQTTITWNRMECPMVCLAFVHMLIVSIPTRLKNIINSFNYVYEPRNSRERWRRAAVLPVWNCRGAAAWHVTVAGLVWFNVDIKITYKPTLGLADANDSYMQSLTFVECILYHQCNHRSVWQRYCIVFVSYCTTGYIHIHE